MIEQLTKERTKAKEQFEAIEKKILEYFRSYQWIKDVVFELKPYEIAPKMIDGWSLVSTTRIPSFQNLNARGTAPENIRIDCFEGICTIYATQPENLVKFIKQYKINFIVDKNILELFSLGEAR